MLILTRQVPSRSAAARYAKHATCLFKMQSA